MVTSPTANAGDVGDLGSIPALERSPAGRHGIASKLRAGPAFWVKRGRQILRKFLLFFIGKRMAWGHLGATWESS